MSTRFNRTRRTRMLVAAAITAAALTLTACNSGEGVNDEGASAGSGSTQAPTATATPSPKESGGTSAGSGKTEPTGSASEGSTGSGGSAGSSGTSGSSGATGSSGSSGSTGAHDGASASGACSPASTRTTATEVSRPLNHLLLTVTNTGSKNCHLTYYPAVRFEGAQSVPSAFEDSKPQAVVTLAPGESGYASVRLAAADGSGSTGHTAKSLEVYFNTTASTAAHPSLPEKGVYVDGSVAVSYWQSTMADALAW